MQGELLHKFRELCRQRDLAVTHQRITIYEALSSMPGHPSPEQVYECVRQQISSISLATVYKTINTFIETGIVHEASLHHGSIRLDSNLEPHHHMVCSKCKTIFDLKFMRHGIKKWITRYRFHRYQCQSCRTIFQPEETCWGKGKFGPEVKSYSL